MSRSRLCVLLAVVLLASVAAVLVVSAVMDPITGLPADLQGKVSFNANGGMSIHGSVTAAQWRQIQDLFLKPHGAVNPWARWEMNRTDAYSTARFVFEDGSVKASGPSGSGIDWVSRLRTLLGELASLTAHGAEAVTSAFNYVFSQAVTGVMNFFTMNAAATCGTGSNLCYWIGGTGNWSDGAHWSDTDGGPGNCSCIPKINSNILVTTNSGTGTLTVDSTPGVSLGSYSGASSSITLAMGANSLSFGTGSTCTVSAGGITNTSGTLTCATVTFSGGYYDGSAGASVVAWGSVSISSASSYIKWGSGSGTVAGTWTNASTSANWAPGTGTITFTSNSGGTMTFAGANLPMNEFFNLTFSSSATPGQTFSMATNGLKWGGALAINDGSNFTTLATSDLPLSGGVINVGNFGVLTANASTASVSGVTMTGTSGTITLTTGSWTVSGNWDTSGTGTIFTAGTSTVTMSGTGATIKIQGLTNQFNALTITGTITLAGAMGASGLTTVAGTLDTSSVGNFALTPAGGLTINGASGRLNTNGSTVTETGAVTVNNAGGFITTGAGGSWTVNGVWSNSSTSASWSWNAATPITFNSTASPTMTFGNVTLEFGGNVSFLPAGTSTFTMSTNALRWGGILTIGNGTNTTTLATSNLGLTGGSLVVAIAGTLTANASVASVSNVTMTGSTGTITLTTGSWTVSGNWDTSGAGATFTAGSSTITMSGAAKTLKTLASGQQFATLTFTGSVTTQSTILATTCNVNAGATLTKTGQSISVNALSVAATGTIADGAVNVHNFSVTQTSGTNLVTFSVFSVWTVNTEFTWTHTGGGTASTITFTIGGNTSLYHFTVTKDTVPFTTGTVNGSGQVIFTMLNTDPVVDIMLTPCGSNRYWKSGAGNWSQTTHWTDTSGGVNSCPIPTNANSVFFDSTAGGGIAAVDQNAVMGSLDTTGWTGTIAVGTFNFAVTNAGGGSGNITHAAGIITIGASAVSGLTATGTLTISGTASIDGSAGASVITIAGATSITAAGGYIKFGSGTYTFSSSWSNSSTSASWAAGTGTVVFNPGVSKTMTFGNLGSNEFNNVSFLPTAAATFTMAHALQWGGLMTLGDGTHAATLDTVSGSSYGLTGGSILVANAGTLLAQASTIAVVNVTMTGGSSGTITCTGAAAWTVSGNWDTSGAGATFTRGTSLVTMTGTGKTVKIATGQLFFGLTLSGGSLTMASFLLANTMTITSGVLDLTGYPLFVNGNLTITTPGSLNFDSGMLTVLGNLVDTSTSANTGSGTLVLPSSATQSVQGGVWPNVQVVGGEKDFTASLTTLNVTLLGNASVTIRVTAGVTWTLTPGGVLSGVSSTARLVLTSSGTWTLNVSSVTGIAQWVAVDHSTATSPGAQGFNSLDNGGNTNWTFPSGAAPLGPFLTLLQHDPVIQLSISALGLVSILAVRRYYKKTVTCPVCGHKFTEEGHEHE